MDSTLILMFVLMNSAYVINGQPICKQMPPSNISVCIASKTVTVKLESAFNLDCTISTHGKCIWHRNGSQIATDTGRYSNELKWLVDGVKCIFKVTEAAMIDSGNWTCRIHAGSEHDGVTSEAILVHVLPKHSESQQRSVLIIHQSRNITVLSGKAFHLNCTFNANAKCKWMLNTIPVISDNKRYLSIEQRFDNGSTTVCSFNVHKADEMDSGNWTCGTLASDIYEEITSEIISVNVHKREMDKSNPTISTEQVDTQSIKSNSTLNIEQTGINITSAISVEYYKETLYTVIGAFTAIITVSITVIILWFCIKRRRKHKVNSSPSPSIHVYEEIDENAIEFSIIAVDPSQSYSHHQCSAPKKGESNDGYKVPMTRDNSTASTSNFGDEKDLNVFKKSMKKQKPNPVHSYQNITQLIN